MIINNNLSALHAWNNLKKKEQIGSNLLKRLSSGLRIISAADDAAGLAISEKMRAQIRGLAQAERNIQDGISLIQTAEGGTNEIHAMLQRARELCVQGANDTLTKNDREAINQELVQIRSEIDNIANYTEFNTIKLLEGSHTGEPTEVTLSAPYIGQFILNGNPTVGSSLGVNNEVISKHARFEFVSNPNPANAWIEVKIEATMEETLNNLKNTFDAIKARTYRHASEQDAVAPMDMHIYGNTVIITSSDNFTQSTSVGPEISGSGVLSGSPAQLTVLDYDNIKKPITLQLGGNSGQSMEVSIQSITSTDLQIDDINVNDGSNASSSLDTIDKAISTVSTVRTRLGAYQNRLEHAFNNAVNYKENLMAAQSRIANADMAKAIMEKAKNDILLQAAQLVLAQANSAPKTILSLLK